MKNLTISSLIIFVILFCSCSQKQKEIQPFDVVVYGGTSAGIIAAIQAVKMGKSAILIEPGKHLGGLTSGGLGATDIGNKAAIGGLSREFYQRINQHYNPGTPKSESMWTFEPHVAEKVFNEMIEEYEIKVLFNERLDQQIGVVKEGTSIREIRMESGSIVKGKMFIDATYEGDLMAMADVSYTFGREANNIYKETLNGVQTKQALFHQFKNPIDPYIIAGKPQSGILLGIQNVNGPGAEGTGDHRIQAYCFRMCLTNIPENRIPFPKPENYDPMRYELLLRYIKSVNLMC
jgi:hypothetical protein